MTTRMVVLGRLTGVFGVRGELKLQSYTAPPGALVKYTGLHAATAQGTWQPFRIAGSRSQGSAGSEHWLVRIEGVTDRDVAAQWAQRDVGVPRESMPPLGPGEYYLDDLPGMAVVTTQGVSLGRVSHLVDTPAHPVMAVVGEGEGAKEHWVPVVRPHVVAVDVATGRVTVDWDPEI